MKQVLIQGPISPAFVADGIQKHAVKQQIGAHSIFLGQVRADETEKGEVEAIIYEAYEEAANLVFHEIREAAFLRFELVCMHIYHSVGLVKAGEISLFVFTSSVHRKAATEACTWIVEEIKKKAPVWGKEILKDGNHVWKQNQ